LDLRLMCQEQMEVMWADK